MKRKTLAAGLAVFFALTIFAGCSKSDEGTKRVRNAGYGSEETVAAESGEAVYGMEVQYEEDYGDLDLEYAANGDDGTGVAVSSDIRADLAKEMLVYRSTLSIDTLDFEGSVSTLKQKVREYNGLIEYEYQTDGNDSNGQYVVDEEDKNYTYSATIRIPSQYYDSFMSSTDGLGILRTKNSTVDNVTTVYGTLKSELEIYEADYARYLEKYEETDDDNVALQIERELRSLALTIADIKTQMSTIEGDVAYSYVTISIHKVMEEEIEPEPTPEPVVDDSFKTELKTTAKESWDAFLEFVQGIILFLVRSWWVLVIIGIIVIVIVVSVKRANKKRRIRNEKYVAEREERERQRKAAIEAEKKKLEGENKAQENKPKDEKVKDEKAEDPDVTEANETK